MKRIKVMFIMAIVLLFMANFSSVGFADPEIALSDPRGNKTILGDYNGETKRVRLDENGNLPLSEASTTIAKKTTSQDLSSSALDYTTNFGAKTELSYILLHASVGITETVTIKINSSAGANYDTLVVDEDLVAGQDVYYAPNGTVILEATDEIDVDCTNNGTTGTVYVVVAGKTLS